MKAEYKEWLGISPADWPVYVSTALSIAMYKVNDFLTDVVLASVSLGLAIWACFIGMKHDPNVSRFTNTVKKVAYPLCFVAGVIVVYLNFSRWS